METISEHGTYTIINDIFKITLESHSLASVGISV
jgi:hypothetical protein